VTFLLLVSKAKTLHLHTSHFCGLFISKCGPCHIHVTEYSLQPTQEEVGDHCFRWYYECG